MSRRTEVILSILNPDIDHTRREKSETNLPVFYIIKMNYERNLADGDRAKQFCVRSCLNLHAKPALCVLLDMFLLICYSAEKSDCDS